MIEAHLLASGSTGNALFFVIDHTRILIDFGLGIRKMRECLAEVGHTLSQLDAVLITHEHTDHVKGLESFLRHHGGEIPVLSRRGTLGRLPGGLAGIDSLYQEINGKAKIGGVEIESFDISHDAEEPVGFMLKAQGKTIVCATDLGVVTPKVGAALEAADILVFEANHDPGLLENGPYPHFLQNRIRGNQGHLSNTDAAQALAELPKKKREIFLAHLSRQNNTPDAALDAVAVALEAQGHRVGDEVRLHLTWPNKIVSASWDFKS
jgi:Metal-dependent hydrolases of the beta-lactamase superfamily I